MLFRSFSFEQDQLGGLRSKKPKSSLGLAKVAYGIENISKLEGHLKVLGLRFNKETHSYE